jgi:hypothetical protein
VIRRRKGSGLAIILIAVILLGAGTALVLSQNKDHGANDPSTQSQVKSTIEANTPRGVAISHVSCKARSSNTMICIADVANKQGTAEATYNATIDTNTGHYKLSPIVSIKPTSSERNLTP